MKTFSYSILFIAASFGISDILSLYISDILAYITGFNVTTILTLIIINKMERELAMQWWNSLNFKAKLFVLSKYKIDKPVDCLTGRQIELIYKKEHKPIKL